MNPERWHQRYGEFLYGFAVKKFGTQDAEDIVQETYASALKTIGKFRGGCSERSWLCTILFTRGVDMTARGSYNRFNFFTNYEGADSVDARWSASPEMVLEAKGIMGAITDVLNNPNFMSGTGGKSERNAQVFRMKYFQGKTAPEISEELGIKQSSVWVICDRVRKKLKEALEEWR